ncbi:MAG: FdtA/QdtA family cupin domain-containing protein [Synergistota bacterium]|nr:FdtA/QdtA family cupin domain-containing protein [Synergistota bacterium]
MSMKMIHRPGALPADGSLCIAESGSKEVPFDIKRVYYIYDVEKGIARGQHAHKILEQILICLHGEIKVTLDDGKGKITSHILKDPSEGLYVGPSTWRTMEWLRTGSVLLVLASEHYDESDYIRDYDGFINWRKTKEI